MEERNQVPPPQGEGDHAKHGGGAIRTLPLPRTRDTARRLRRDMALPEIVLWTELRRRPSGLKFRRQHPAGTYVLSFYCSAARLAVEVDGEVHSRGKTPQRDEERDAWLAAQGIATLRLPAAVVLRDMDATLRAILVAAEARTNRPLHQPPAGPPPRAGEERAKDVPEVPPPQGEGDHAQHGGGGVPARRSQAEPDPETRPSKVRHDGATP